MDREDGETLMGFYTTRFVRATNPKEAELKCLRLLRRKDEYGNKRNSGRKGSAKVYFLDITKAKRQSSFSFGKGNVFFRMIDVDENGEHLDALEIELEAHAKW